MNNRAIRAASSELPALAAGVAGAADASSLLVDSAISHAEKLRRVLQLEEWINGTPDTPMFEATRRKWQEQRERLVAELHLGELSAANPVDPDVASRQAEPSANEDAALETPVAAPEY
jgi:hypothetical protein